MGELVATEESADSPATQTLFQRKYVIPFILACAVLGLTQATGVNSILQYLVIILQQAGLDGAPRPRRSTMPISAVNCVFTLAGFFLVDRLGRKGMLMIGTGGITVALVVGAFAFHHFESRRGGRHRRLAGRRGRDRAGRRGQREGDFGSRIRPAAGLEELNQLFVASTPSATAAT